MEIFADHRRRSITTRAELASLILEELDGLQHDLQHDRALRAQVWHRQRRDDNWQGYVPLEELELSTWLRDHLQQRLGARVALLREVQIQPRLGSDPADEPDVVAVALTSGELIDLPVEVKGNWNERVVADLTSQLISRYLNGPLGSDGIYVVGYFQSDAWSDDDARRRGAARRHSRQQVQADLLAGAKAAPTGKLAHIYVIDLPLDADDMDD
jgi:hypothetical protein